MSIDRAYSREKCIYQTWASIQPHLNRIGITRLANITGLDRVGIPAYSAVVPRSQDILSVYNGKGVSELAAKVSAAMEAIERVVATTINESALTSSSMRDFVDRGVSYLNPKDFRIPFFQSPVDPDRSILWVGCWDAIRRCLVYVPAELIFHNSIGRLGEPVYTFCATNGLASGNSVVEATNHAIYELVERDAWTLAEMRARFSGQVSNTSDRASDSALRVDLDTIPSLSFDGLNDQMTRLIERFTSQDISVNVKVLTSDIGIPTFLATSIDSNPLSNSRSHLGLGCDLDAGVALRRALTELAQSRAVDIQGVREDLVMHGEAVIGVHHTKRVEEPDPTSWYHTSSVKIAWKDVAQSFSAHTPQGDQEEILRRLRSAGIRSVLVHRFKFFNDIAPVVRVLCPELESWSTDRRGVGARAFLARREVSSGR